MDLISCKSDDGSIKLADPRIIAAETAQKDNLHLVKAMKADGCEDFVKAMEKRNKIFDHRRCLGNTSKIPTYSFSTHNTINTELHNHKAHFYVHGGMQRKWIDFNNTSAHAVNWSTVRLIIMMAIMDVWESRQINYVLDLSQAPIDGDVCLHLPAGFHVHGKDLNETYFI